MMTTIKIIFIVISIKNKIRSIVLLANAWEHSYKCPCSSKLCYALIGWLHLMLFFLISAWKPLGWYRRPVGFVDWCFSYDRCWNIRVYKQLVNLPVFKAFRQIDLALKAYLVGDSSRFLWPGGNWCWFRKLAKRGN